MNNLTYKYPPVKYFSHIKSWYHSRFIKDPLHRIRDEEILSCPSIFTMTNVAVSSFSEKGDGIMVFTPCYIQYYKIIHALGRRPIEVQLSSEKNGL
jgi:bifunctional pyridoxal-dependent enzyme with beta-cystathionase and maltose regulon repressor activities